MAIVTRYFSTTSAGAADGTTWADRAELLPSSNWSTVITGFSFSGSDSLRCLIGPGTYSCGQALVSGLFAAAPTAANPLILNGCDSSGNALSVPDPNWTADLPAFDSSTFPVIATTTNITTLSLANTTARLLAFTASGRNGQVINAGQHEWIVITNSTANTSAIGISDCERLTNMVVNMTGSSYNYALGIFNGYGHDNIRLVGNAGSSGNRYGLNYTGTTAGATASRIVMLSNGGPGFVSTSTNASQRLLLSHCMSLNNTGSGFLFASTASQTQTSMLVGCIATGNGAYGVDAQSAANLLIVDCRFRDNTSGNLNGLGNYPTDLGTYTTDSSDADEYVDSGAGNYQIKSTADIAGLGFGISEQCPAGSGGAKSFVFGVG